MGRVDEKLFRSERRIGGGLRRRGERVGRRGAIACRSGRSPFAATDGKSGLAKEDIQRQVLHHGFLMFTRLRNFLRQKFLMACAHLASDGFETFAR